MSKGIVDVADVDALVVQSLSYYAGLIEELLDIDAKAGRVIDRRDHVRDLTALYTVIDYLSPGE